MSGYKMHWFFGVSVVALIAYLSTQFHLGLIPTSLLSILTILGIALFYSILPDIDTTSKVRRIVVPIMILLALVIFFINELISFLILLLLGVIFMLKHRGITHRYWFAFAIALPLLYIFGMNKTGFVYYFIGVTSYMSHLFLDGVKR